MAVADVPRGALNRLYVPEIELVEGGEIVLVGPRHHYIGRVLRARPGSSLELFRGDGAVHTVELLEIGRRELRARVVETRGALSPSPLAVTLIQAMPRGKKLDSIIQKSTELGVATIRLAVSERCQVKASDRDARKLERLRAIAVEAAEQCGRGEVPEVHAPRPLGEVLEATDSDARAILWESARTVPLAAAVPEDARSVALASGPEGGFASEEVECAAAAGFAPVTLGPRILRAETASPAALAILQAIRGDM